MDAAVRGGAADARAAARGDRGATERGEEHLVSAGLEPSELGSVRVAQAEPAEPLRGGLHLLDRSPRKVPGNPRSVGAGRGTSAVSS